MYWTICHPKCWPLPLNTNDKPYDGNRRLRKRQPFWKLRIIDNAFKHHRRSPAPKRLATTTAAMLPTSPLIDGASPGAMLCELAELEEAEEVEVPLVVLWSDWTSADRLGSVEKAALTELPLLQSDVWVPDPETKFTVAH